MNPNPITLLGVEFLAKSTCVVLAAALLNLALRQASAAVRHAVWLGAVVVILMLPLTKAVSPLWAWRPPAPQAVQFVPGSLAVVEPVFQGAPTQDAARAKVQWSLPSMTEIAMWAWAGGAVLVLGCRLIGSVHLVLLRRRSRPAEDPRLRARVALLSAEMEVARTVDLRLSPAGGVPVTWGLWRSVLLLPESATEWSDGQLNAALRHELGHIARHDYFTRWLAHLACALFWLNPLVWFATRVLRREQEQACDDLVLRAGTPADYYASFLLAAARSLAECDHGVHAVAMARPSTLERRVLAIMDEERDRRPASSGGVFFAVCGVAATLAFSAAAQLLGADSANQRVASGAPILIEAHFVEIAADAKVPEPLQAVLKPGATGLTGVYTGEQFAKVMQSLAKAKGIDLLAAPKITTRAGQPAKIMIGREFRYPSEWKKTGAGWEPVDFQTREVGVSLEVTAAKGAAGKTLDLELKPQVIEFVGWRDAESNENLPVTGASAVNGGEPPAAQPPPGRPLHPVFFERKISSTVSVYSEQTVVLTDIGRSARNHEFPSARADRSLVVFVTARLLQESEVAGGVPERTAGNVARPKAESTVPPHGSGR